MTAQPTALALAAPEAPEREPLRRYEMWIKTVLSPALIASFPVRAETTRVPRRSIGRFRVHGDRDLTAVVRRLAECGVEVVELRVVDRCA